MKVIPSINCEDEACVRNKIAMLRPWLPEGSLVHGDVTDGVFSKHATWNHPQGWSSLGAPFALEVHLMVEHPLDYADDWFAAGARRLLVHVETLTPESFHALSQLAEQYKGSLMLTSKPETPCSDLEPWIERFSAFQVLAVTPGEAGQTFLPIAIEKIRFLREAAPDATIEVDGGMNRETAHEVKSAGADTIVSAHYIFESSDPKKAFEDLRNI